MSPMSPRLLRPRATGFNPKSIANLALWLDGADYNATTGQWDDKSGNGRNFSQSVANDRPTKTAKINGRDVVSFDGSNDCLSCPAVSFSQWSAFALVRPGRVTGDNGVINADTGTVRGPQYIRWSSTTYQSVNFQATNSVVAESSSVAAATNVARIVAVVQTASAFEMWIDGTSNGSTSCTPQSYSSVMGVGATRLNPATLAANSGIMLGDIGEILFWSRALTSAERETVQRYLGRKWGITI